MAKLSVDARHGKPSLVCTAAISLKEPGQEAAAAARSRNAALAEKPEFLIRNGTQRLAARPVVCGLGPAGLFAALRELDRTDITTIYARCPEGGGVAYAVGNRLKKAAGFHVVNAEETR